MDLGYPWNELSRYNDIDIYLLNIILTNQSEEKIQLAIDQRGKSLFLRDAFDT